MEFQGGQFKDKMKVKAAIGCSLYFPCKHKPFIDSEKNICLKSSVCSLITKKL